MHEGDIATWIACAVRDAYTCKQLARTFWRSEMWLFLTHHWYVKSRHCRCNNVQMVSNATVVSLHAFKAAQSIATCCLQTCKDVCAWKGMLRSHVHLFHPVLTEDWCAWLHDSNIKNFRKTSPLGWLMSDDTSKRNSKNNKWNKSPRSLGWSRARN